MAEAEGEAGDAMSADGEMASAETGAEGSTGQDTEMAEAGGEAEGTGDTAEAAMAEASQTEMQDALVNGPDVSVEGYNTATLETLRADRLMDQSIFGINGSQIGDVGDIVLTDDGEIGSIVVETGGFPRPGRREVAVRLRDMTILQSTDADDIRVYTSLSEQDLEEMQEANQPKSGPLRTNGKWAARPGAPFFRSPSGSRTGRSSAR